MSSVSLFEAISESPQVVKMNKELELCFCQAVEYNYERALKAILTKVKDPSAVVNKVYTKESEHFVPMLVACEKGYVSIVEILLQNGGAKSLTKLNKHKCNCLHTACRAGNFQIVKLLCDRALRKMINQKSEFGWTPLMFAIKAKQVDIVNHLLKIPIIASNSLTKKGQNIAHIAAQCSLDCLKAIQMSRHQTSSLFLATDKEGRSILHRACAAGNIDTLKWILELRTKSDGSDGVLTPNDEGYSDGLPLLFKTKLDEKTKSGYTPLLTACEYQHKDMVEYLLSLPGVDASVSTSMEGRGKGNTGLHIAAIHDSPDIAELLIHRGCPTKAINKEGDTALHIAQRKSSFDVFDILNLKDAGLKEIPNKVGKRADEMEHEQAIPPEILKRGPKAERVFRKALREGKQKIPQCKLLVLGEARVGKTSLVRHMTGCKFILNLDPTRGIENECITTMIDSTNIDISNWKKISESEQAERIQEHCISAIAQVIKTEYPALLETQIEKENSDYINAEPQITEDQLLSQIKDLVEKEELEYNKSKHVVEQYKNNDLALEFSDRTRSTALPHRTSHSTQPLPPTEQKKQGDSVPLRNPTTIKNTRVRVASENSAAPNDAQIQLVTSVPVYTPTAVEKEPIKRTVVAQISGLGRRNVYQKLCTTAQKTQEPSLCLDVLDFAGQEVYRPMHHCFMSRRAIYIVVLNLQHLLDPIERRKTFADLQYWLNSIHAHVHSPGYNYEKYIFLVGTHKNPGNVKHGITDDDLKKFSSELQGYFFESDCHFKDEIHFFSHTGLIISALENSMDQGNSGIEAIKKEIEDFSKRLPFVAENYPISWVSFREKLLKRKLPGSPLLQLAEAKEIAKGCGVEDQAVNTALQLFHDTGVIIYPAVIKSIFLEESEKHQISTVILMKPKWLISIMTKVMEVPMSDPTLRNTDIDNLKKTGMASREFLYQLWQDDHKGDGNQFQIICLLMRSYGLMQAIKPPIGSNHVRFMIPCLLHQEELNCQNGYTFYFDFKGFLPQEVFHCLICLVIKKCQEVPDCYSPRFSANACVWFWFKGFYWHIQLQSQEHRLKVVAKPRGEKKSDDLNPIECISFLHKEYICPICDQSGLPGLAYKAGPMVEVCRMKAQPHSAGVLAVVRYPEIGSNETMKLVKCHNPTCCEEYSVIEVFLQTYPSKILVENYSALLDSILDTDMLADSLHAKGFVAGRIRDDVKGCHKPKEKNRVLIEAIQQQVNVNPGCFQTFVDALKMDKNNYSAVSLLTGGGASIGDNRSDRRQCGVGGGGDDFKNVSSDQLDDDDLVDVMDEVMDVASKWKSVGLALRLKAAELDAISSKNSTDPTECLRDMVLAWLQQRYDIKKFGLPSWRMLCQAISKSAGGNNPALARKIAEHH